MSSSSPAIANENGSWSVTVINAGGRTQRYECATEEQAQTFASLFLAPDRRHAAKRSDDKRSPRWRGWLQRLAIAR
jgi:hypothetical protein